MAEIPTVYHKFLQETLHSHIELNLKFLLENKYLYQSWKIPEIQFSEISGNIRSFLSPTSDMQVEGLYSMLFSKDLVIRWKINNSDRNGGYALEEIPEKTEFILDFLPLTIKKYCQKCDDIEPHNYIDGREVIDTFSDELPIQIFTMNYLCQGCKDSLLVYLVRREGLKISINGRSPIESVQLPSFLPKDQRRFISDGIVAFRSGQVLAGIFLLRTFIEQYVRSYSNDYETQNMDGLFEKYSECLPQDFKDRFPSLKSIYEQLSNAIHKADGSVTVFQEQSENIILHFEAKRLYKL